jgi:cell division protein FtsB
MSLGQRLREPQPPPPPASRARRWLILGALELLVVAVVVFVIARTGAGGIDRAQEAIEGSREALWRTTVQSADLARNVARLQDDESTRKLPAEAAALEALTDLDERLAAAEALDRSVAMALATRTPTGQRRLERRKGAITQNLATLAKTRETNRRALSLAHLQLQEAARSGPARLAMFLGLADDPASDTRKREGK